MELLFYVDFKYYTSAVQWCDEFVLFVISCAGSTFQHVTS